MKVATWYNLVQKKHEAVIVGRGRPLPMNASAADREKSTREFFVGDSREAALKALADSNGLTLDEVVASVDKDTKLVYKGKREHVYNRKNKVETPQEQPVEA